MKKCLDVLLAAGILGILAWMVVFIIYQGGRIVGLV